MIGANAAALKAVGGGAPYWADNFTFMSRPLDK